MRRLTWLVCACLLFAGCAPSYSLVSPSTLQVARGTMSVKTGMSWNKMPKNQYDIRQEESWTANGPLLDRVTFIAGVEDGEAIARQKPKDDRQVPVFRKNMTPPDLVAMIESYYRIKAGATVFRTTSVAPATFLGGQGIQLDYSFIGADDVKRKGRSMLAVIDDRFYLMALDGTELHYFDAVLVEFESMANSASIS